MYVCVPCWSCRLQADLLTDKKTYLEQAQANGSLESKLEQAINQNRELLHSVETLEAQLQESKTEVGETTVTLEKSKLQLVMQMDRTEE